MLSQFSLSAIAELETGRLVSSFFALTAIISLRYFAVSGITYWLLADEPKLAFARRLMDRDPNPALRRQEIYWSVIASFIYAVPATLVLELWLSGHTAIYNDLSLLPLWYVPVSLLIYFFLHDTYFYWSHRWMHWKVLYPTVHKVHHLSRPPSAWAAFSFHAYESLILSWVIPALTLIVPIHIGALLFMLTIMTINATLNHCGYEILPKSWIKSWFGEVLVTATHHNLHHKHYNCNYALYFRFWDKLMRTDRMEYGP